MRLVPCTPSISSNYNRSCLLLFYESHRFLRKPPAFSMKTIKPSMFFVEIINVFRKNQMKLMKIHECFLWKTINVFHEKPWTFIYEKSSMFLIKKNINVFHEYHERLILWYLYKRNFKQLISSPGSMVQQKRQSPAISRSWFQHLCLLMVRVFSVLLQFSHQWPYALSLDPGAKELQNVVDIENWPIGVWI